MTDAITASLARQTGLQRELAIIANNIANASTEGFKREAAVFAEYISVRDDSPSMSLGALRAHFTDVSPGTMRQTDGPLDLAIEGEGWFGVERGDEVLLTRAGSFVRNADGRLATTEGYPVVDEGGGRIDIPPETAQLTVSADGTVTADGFGIARIGILTTPPDRMERVGDNLWRATGPVGYAEDARVRQGYLEASNVSPVEEMARLIEAQRMFEAGSSLQTEEHDRIQSMIEALSRS